jgi:hypothetical protein
MTRSKAIMAMKGWIRLGIVLSVLWLPVGYIWGMSGDNWATKYYIQCVEMNDDRAYHDNNDLDMKRWEERDQRCQENFTRSRPAAFKEQQINAAVLAIFPIVLGWILGVVAIAVGRWVYRGFMSP